MEQNELIEKIKTGDLTKAQIIHVVIEGLDMQACNVYRMQLINEMHNYITVCAGSKAVEPFIIVTNEKTDIRIATINKH